jgi:rubrerythrin
MDKFNSINDILDFAMEQEQEAINFYRQLAAHSKNDEMKAVFEEFAKEEVSHKARLQKIKNEQLFNIESEDVADLKIADYVVNVKPTPDMKYEDALKLAMNKEKAAFKLYTNLAQKVTSHDLKIVFQSLAIEESKHKLRFELEYDEYVLREN